MSHFKNLAFTALTLFNVAVVLVLLVTLSSVGYDNEIRVGRDRAPNFALEEHLGSMDSASCISDFPYQEYSVSANGYHVLSIKQDLELLDSICGNANTSMEIVYNALTEVKRVRLPQDLNDLHIDSVIKLVHWIERFQHFEKIDPAHAICYGAVAMYWYQFITEWMEAEYKEDFFVKFSFKFKYIKAKCHLAGFHVSISADTNLEKALENVIHGNWGYLIQKTLLKTGLVLKLCLSVLVIFTFYTYWLFVKSIVNTKK